MRRSESSRKRARRMMASSSDGSGNEPAWNSHTKVFRNHRRSSENKVNNQPFVRHTRSSARMPNPCDAEPSIVPKSRVEESFSSSIDFGSSTFFDHTQVAASSDVRLTDFSRQDSHSSPSPSPDHKLSRQRGKLVHFQTPEQITEHRRSSVTGDHSTTPHRSFASSGLCQNSVSDSDSGRSSFAFSRILRPRVSVTSLSSSTGGRHSRTANPVYHNIPRRLRGRPRKRAASADESLDVPDVRRKSTRCSDEHEDSDDGIAEPNQDERKSVSSGRRYPVRNRRNTAMYQIEYPQHNHGSTRNWLAGTGYENGGRRRRGRLHRSRPSRGPHHYCSSTSSSADSDSGSSVSDRDVAAESTAYRTRFHTSWHRGGAVPGASATQVDADEVRFARRCTKSILHSRSELMPINLKRKDINATLNDRLLSGSTLADIEPMTIDESVGFDQVGGHEHHIMALKESIILPLMYPEVFSLFDIDPPRGVLFSGPPGTGKTLLARALANECTRLALDNKNDSNLGISLQRPIAFFMRKGADCLSKWVGESERQLRLLFDQAYRMRPSIIFFDEIDGLAPVRSSRQDQIHSSIVSTLLSLMDGLDARAEVVIIGATNRPDAIDPALRRPGRFDREFTFDLPCASVRLQILKVHTSKWNPKPDTKLLNQVANVTGNFSGADLKAVVTEACLSCLRRQYPQVYLSRVKLHLDSKYLVVERQDWLNALQSVKPSNCRSDVDASSVTLTPSSTSQAATKRSPLPIVVANLLGKVVEMLALLFSHALKPSEYPFEELLKLSESLDVVYSGTFASPKFLIFGDIPDCLMHAVWHRLELLQIFTLSITNLVVLPLNMGICPEAAIAQILSAVKRAMNVSTPRLRSDRECVQGVVLYLPCVDVLFSRLAYTTTVYLVDRLEALIRESIVNEIASVPSQPVNCIEEFSRAVSACQHRLMVVATIQSHVRPISQQHRNINQFFSRASRDRLSVDEIPSPRHSTALPPQPTSLGTMYNGITPARKISPRSKSSRHMDSPSIIASSPVALNTNNCSICSSLQSDLPPVDSSSPLSSEAKSLGVERNSAGCLATSKNFTSCPTKPPFLTHKDDTLPEHIGRYDKECPRRLLSRLFSQCGSVHVHIGSSTRSIREAFFSSLFDMWFRRGARGSDKTELSAEGSIVSRPPSPLPVIQTTENIAAANSVARLTPEELLQVEREEAQLFRRLRQVLRRVVAHLARHRRFAVFTRPVQVDEAPDYYDVIKNPMDLGSIRDRIDARHYTNVEDFMKDVELIYYNALEYNPPNVPRSRDIRSRASEFWDEACLKLEEELHPPDLNERCKAVTEAQLVRSQCAMRIKKSCTSRVPKSLIVSTHDKDMSGEEQPAVKSYPLPQGPRYSRRVQGEPPVLESHDVELLQSMTNRRTSSSSLILSDSETKNLQEKVCIIEHSADLDGTTNGTVSSESTSVEWSHKPQDNEGLVPLNSVSTPNPLIVTQPPNFGATEVLSSTSTPVKMTSPLEKTKLETFIRMIVDESQGWSFQQLLEVYRELSHIILTTTPGSDGQMVNVLSRMEHVFRTFSEQCKL